MQALGQMLESFRARTGSLASRGTLFAEPVCSEPPAVEEPAIRARLRERCSVPVEEAVELGELLVGPELLAAGPGSARAHLAKRRTTGELVRLERLGVDEASDPSARRAFIHLGRWLQALTHPNAMQVVALGLIGREPGARAGSSPRLEPERSIEPYRLLEHPIGLTLEDLARSIRHRPPDLVLTAGARALEVLQHAHARRDYAGRPLLHGSFSPRSIVLVPGGELKVVGFGAAPPGQNVPPERMRALAGSLRYLAPEQRRGEPLDTRTDVYAAAKVMLVLLTGGDVGEPEPALGTVPRVKARLQDLPRALIPVFARALAYVPAERFASAAEFRRALESAAGRHARMRPEAIDKLLFSS